MTCSLQDTPVRQLTGKALPGTSAARKYFLRNPGGPGATPAAHQGESISCCCEGQWPGWCEEGWVSRSMLAWLLFRTNNHRSLSSVNPTISRRLPHMTSTCPGVGQSFAPAVLWVCSCAARELSLQRWAGPSPSCKSYWSRKVLPWGERHGWWGCGMA